MPEQIPSIPFLVYNSVIRLFGDTGPVSESNRDTKDIYVIQTVLSKIMPKSFQSTAFHSAVEKAVQKSVPKTLSVDVVGIKLVDAIAFTILMAGFVNHDV